MNQEASPSDHERDESPQTGSEDLANEQPILAVATETEGETIRIGSPFAADPFQLQPVEVLYDVGPIRYTAMGAVAASVMVIAFALAAAFWFPSGGTLISALGCALSIFGLYSNYRYVAAGLLATHLGIFTYSYIQTLG
ncbi:MAG: hypothetical protein AB8B91_14980 [Rubripirellula sp.]